MKEKPSHKELPSKNSTESEKSEDKNFPVANCLENIIKNKTNNNISNNYIPTNIENLTKNQLDLINEIVSKGQRESISRKNSEKLI